MSALAAALTEARHALRVRRRRTLLSGLGIALAATMLSAALVVADGLGRGFTRAAHASDLPDVIVRFDPQPAQRIAARIRSLPDVAAYATRLEVTGLAVGARGHRSDDAIAEVVDPEQRRGYAVVAGRDLHPLGSEVLVERAFAEAWGVQLGDELFVDGLGRERVVGLTEAPDNVGFPLAKPRFYASRPAIDALFGAERAPRANIAQIWLSDRRYLDEVLVQARASSFGLRNVRFATRSGIRVLLDQAAGIVIDLLVALSAIALLTAGTMLFASARAEVQRRLGAIGIRRAVGTSRAQVTLSGGLEAMLIAAPAAGLGVLAGALATYGPADRLLTLLNEPAPGTALAGPLAAAWATAVALPALGAAWPAWRAGGIPVVGLLRGADVAGGAGRVGGAGGRLAGEAGGRARRHFSLGGRGMTTLGVRLAGARRTRMLLTALTVGVSTAFVLLMLALAGALHTLQTDPGALGKRYQLTAGLPPSSTRAVRALGGVAAVVPRYEVQAADSFSLGESIDVVAFAGDHTAFEAPRLVSGRRLRGSHQAEVGEGLADALGLRAGATLALALPSGRELRLRVAGSVSSLAHDGRVAYVPASALLAADPSAPSQLAIRLTTSAGQTRVSDELQALGAQPAAATGATERGAPLVDTLRAIVIAVAVVDGLVCVYALIQACALTVQERRRTIAVLRAAGAGPRAVRQLLTGAVLALAVPALLLGVLLERLVFGPALARLAAGYATLPLGLSVAEAAATVAGVLVAGTVAVVWVARQAGREPVVRGLSG